jgi:hypothetical protein
MIRMRAAAAVLVLGLWFSVNVTSQGGSPRANPSGNGAFTFGLIGDMPYGPEGELKFPNVIADINQDRTLAFVAHDGDIKNGSTVCSNEMFANRLERFYEIEHPLIYVPGDNEWTDCHRANNGAYDPIERLAYLRDLFFPTDESLGARTLTLERQSAEPQYALYRENVRWVVKNVMFAGLHVVGSNNNLGRTPAADAEYAARNAATVSWLHDTFDLATAQGYKAVMLVIQANPNFDLPPAQRTGFNHLLAALEAETLAFEKPVVLVHGDSHYFRIDKPMLGTISRRRVENFTRVETFGENDNHWLRVTVEPGNPNVFAFDQRIVATNLVQH